jgi:hypothetical protein
MGIPSIREQTEEAMFHMTGTTIVLQFSRSVSMAASKVASNNAEYSSCTFGGCRWIQLFTSRRHPRRTELTGNLKSLFRPIEMMVPDYVMIAGVILYSEGFNNAKHLAQKYMTSFI